MHWLLPIIVAVSIGVAHGASLRRGQVLYEHGRLEEAKHALVDVVTGDTGNDEKAGALYLLGAIALEEKHYPIAARMWSDLIQRYPDSAEAREARSKLPTIPNGIQSSKVRVESPQGYGVAPPDEFEGVRITGTGAEPQYSGQMVKELVNLLSANGVTVSRTQPQSRGTVSNLVLIVSFGYRDSLQAQCYSAQGSLLWSEKATGYFGLSKASVTEGLIDRIKSKIEPHIGDNCLRRS